MAPNTPPATAINASVATAVASSEGLLHDPSDRRTEVESLDEPASSGDGGNEGGES